MSRNIRLNPRQRWHQDPSDLPRGGSTVAGVPAVFWGAFITYAHEMRKNSDPNRRGKGWEAHDRAMQEFGDQLFRALKGLDSLDPLAHPANKWVVMPRLRVRAGRGTGPDQEITVVANDYSDMRSFLTQASLGITDRYPMFRSDMTKWDALLYHVLWMLEKSADRRPWNRYTYLGFSYRELDRYGINRRLERARWDAKFRKDIDRSIEQGRTGRTKAA